LDEVTSVTSEEYVVPLTAADPIVAIEAFDQVVAGEAVNHVWAGGAHEVIVTPRSQKGRGVTTVRRSGSHT
jgi:hypothetical protein